MGIRLPKPVSLCVAHRRISTPAVITSCRRDKGIEEESRGKKNGRRGMGGRKGGVGNGKKRERKKEGLESWLVSC